MAHAEGGRKNRLAGESSPYLLLHQFNPVDWYAWGEEALAKARRENKPIFLSVGYSTCYWCHVMERESFSNPEVAAYLNEHFVAIKVDREERPDLDEIYMTATQALTQSGGWPNSVFLTPGLQPFYAGTYFPPDDRYGRPGFLSLLRSLAGAWLSRRAEVERSAAQVTEVMRRYLEEQEEGGAKVPGPGVAKTSLDLLVRRYDKRHGGFGGAPKFPAPSNLLLAHEWAGENPEAAEMLSGTLDAMARGGIYDQLAGGFHRYATDVEWLIPHFEKMLYDNGFLLELYALEHARTGSAEAARIVRETARFLALEMSSPEGALYSAIDAETDGHEGAYYVWTREELDLALGAGDAAFLASIYGFGRKPFFEDAFYVLHLPAPVAELAAERVMTAAELLARVEPLKAKLLAARSARKRPLTDDKVLADWSGIAVTGLATAGRVLQDPALVAQAARAANYVLERMRPAGGTLLHSSRAGAGKIPAFLADYAFFVRGLLALHEASGEERWLVAAVALAEEQIRRLRDPEGGFYVAADTPDLLFRSKEPIDGALPSANAIAALNFLELARRTGEERWQKEAASSLKAFGRLVERAPDALRTMAIAARRFAASASAASQVAVAAPAAPAPQAPTELERQATKVVETALVVGDGERFGWRPFVLSVTIAPGWHVNANPASEELLISTSVEGDGAEVRNLVYPPGESFRATFATTPISVYQGTIEIRGEVRRSLPRGSGLGLEYQACDEARCLPPVVRLVPLPG